MRASVWLVAATLVVGCARGESVQLVPPPGSQEPSVAMQVVRPDGGGPFPAVVWMHSCAGLVRAARHVEEWTRRLVGMGYVVAIPDSFSERGYPRSVCGYGMRVPPMRRVDDAYAALRHLRRDPAVVPERVGIIGYSHGGWTVLAAIDDAVARDARAAASVQRGFAAGIAFYPDCEHGSWITAYRASAPLLILAGELDDWTPAEPRRQLAEQTRAQGQPVTLIIYPGAHHSFDTYLPVRRVPEARQGRGATAGGQNAAREDSIDQVETFFARYLR